MPMQPPWPRLFDILRTEGRLQFRWLPQSGQWYAALPELGVEIRCGNARALTLALLPHVNRLPRAEGPQRVNGFEWPEPMPASRNLLPRR